MKRGRPKKQPRTIEEVAKATALKQQYLPDRYPAKHNSNELMVKQTADGQPTEEFAEQWKQMLLERNKRVKEKLEQSRLLR